MLDCFVLLWQAFCLYMCFEFFFMGGKEKGTVVLVGVVRKGCNWYWDEKCENNVSGM